MEVTRACPWSPIYARTIGNVMLNLVAIFLTAFVVGLSGAMMPGPVLTVTISETYKKGFWAGPLLVLGHAMLELTLIIGLVLGLNKFLDNEYVKGIVGMGGGLFLLWMGYDITKSAITKAVTLNTQGSSESIALGPVLAGITVSISNPYWTLWWITVGIGFVLQAVRYKFLGLAFFYSGHILADLLWYSFISLVVVSGKKFISDHIYRNILVFCGLFLIGFAVFFVYSGIRFLS